MSFFIAMIKFTFQTAFTREERSEMYNVGQTLIPAPAGQLHRDGCNILLVKMTRSFESRISRLLVKIISVKIVMLTDNFIL